MYLKLCKCVTINKHTMVIMLRVIGGGMYGKGRYAAEVNVRLPLFWLYCTLSVHLCTIECVNQLRWISAELYSAMSHRRLKQRSCRICKHIFWFEECIYTSTDIISMNRRLLVRWGDLEYSVGSFLINA